jgi:hypothetical protein
LVRPANTSLVTRNVAASHTATPRANETFNPRVWCGISIPVNAHFDLTLTCAYSETILSSKPVQRVCPLATIFGSNVAWRSRLSKSFGCCRCACCSGAGPPDRASRTLDVSSVRLAAPVPVAFSARPIESKIL